MFLQMFILTIGQEKLFLDTSFLLFQNDNMILPIVLTYASLFLLQFILSTNWGPGGRGGDLPISTLPLKIHPLYPFLKNLT